MTRKEKVATRPFKLSVLRVRRGNPDRTNLSSLKRLYLVCCYPSLSVQSSPKKKKIKGVTQRIQQDLQWCIPRRCSQNRNRKHRPQHSRIQPLWWWLVFGEDLEKNLVEKSRSFCLVFLVARTRKMCWKRGNGRSALNSPSSPRAALLAAKA